MGEIQYFFGEVQPDDAADPAGVFAAVGPAGAAFDRLDGPVLKQETKNRKAARAEPGRLLCIRTDFPPEKPLFLRLC